MESGKKQQADDVTVIDLAEVFHVLARGWKILLLGLIIGAGAVFAYCHFLVTPEYASTAKLYVLSKSTSITSLADIQAGSSLTTDYLSVVSSRPIYESVQKQLDLDMDYDEFSDKLTVNNPSDTRILEITAQDPDPKEAKRIADCTARVAARFISAKMDQDPPNLIQTGYSDGDPVTPQTSRNTAVGGIVGVLICAIILIANYLANDKVEVPDDIEKKIGMTVLGSLPLEGSGGSSRRHNGRGGQRDDRHERHEERPERTASGRESSGRNTGKRERDGSGRNGGRYAADSGKNQDRRSNAVARKSSYRDGADAWNSPGRNAADARRNSDRGTASAGRNSGRNNTDTGRSPDMSHAGAAQSTSGKDTVKTAGSETNAVERSRNTILKKAGVSIGNGGKASYDWGESDGGDV